MSTKPLTYASAGVDINAGNQLIERIKPIAQATKRPEVLTGLGGFGGLFALPLDKYHQPVLVSGTDGVGSKLKFAIETGIHDTIGIDLVAMCANDVIVCGAEPLFFLDYYATGKLDIDIAEHVVRGIGLGCQEAGMALIGGETAEMPGLYANNDYDLAGFCVGIVERNAIIDGEKVGPGDVLIGLPSSGIHANGYSLVRKVLQEKNIALTTKINDQSLAELLLIPTRIYVSAIANLQKSIAIHALAHITGGGLLENLPRVLPNHCKAVLNTDNWPPLPIFEWLAKTGNIERMEMYRTFNCGIGMVICVAKENVENTLTHLKASGESAYVIGHIASRNETESYVII